MPQWISQTWYWEKATRHTRFNIYKVQKEANKKVVGGKEAKAVYRILIMSDFQI